MMTGMPLPAVPTQRCVPVFLYAIVYPPADSLGVKLTAGLFSSFSSFSSWRACADEKAG
jgi:uncharacterized membrane protein